MLGISGLGGGIASVLLFAFLSPIPIAWQIRRKGRAQALADIRREIPWLLVALAWVFILGLRLGGEGSTGLYFVWLALYAVVAIPVLIREFRALKRDHPGAWEALGRQAEGGGWAPWRVHWLILKIMVKLFIAGLPLTIMAMLLHVPIR